MIENYLKAAINSMWRRKWFSLLTLFSIALSLVVVICGASIWNMMTAPIAPEVNKDRTFFLNAEVHIKQDGEEISYINAMDIVPKSFFSEDVYNIKIPELTSVYYRSGTHEFFRNNRSKKFETFETDHNFFKLYDFNFIEGKPYTINDVDNMIPSCVISKEMAKYYFNGNNCLGKIIPDRSQKFKVVGVIEKPAGFSQIKSDLYYQITSAKSRQNEWWDVAFLCHSANDKKILDAKLNRMGQLYSEQHKQKQVGLNSVSSSGKWFAGNFRDDAGMWLIFMVLLLVVLIIPALGLIDILKNNQSNRSEELAIRRAFGATQRKIATMLLINNIFVTTLGGLLGLIFSFLFFVVLSDDSIATVVFVFFDWRAFFYYFLVFLLIGGIAGILPAHKMAKLQIVNSLNSIEND